MVMVYPDDVELPEGMTLRNLYHWLPPALSPEGQATQEQVDKAIADWKARQGKIIVETRISPHEADRPDDMLISDLYYWLGMAVSLVDGKAERDAITKAIEAWQNRDSFETKVFFQGQIQNMRHISEDISIAEAAALVGQQPTPTEWFLNVEWKDHQEGYSHDDFLLSPTVWHRYSRTSKRWHLYFIPKGIQQVISLMDGTPVHECDREPKDIPIYVNGEFVGESRESIVPGETYEGLVWGPGITYTGQQVMLPSEWQPRGV